MAQNIFTAENLAQYINPSRAGSYGLNNMWTTNDGENCMNLPPSPFYWTSDGTYYKKILCDYFEEGKRYVFDLWIDSDTAISGNANRPQGLTIYYTDGTSEYTNTTVVGASGTGLSYQHKRYVTPAGKSVLGIGFYYYTSTDTFYRWDSSITEYDGTSFEKDTTADVGYSKEGRGNMSVGVGGLIDTNRIYEI